MTHPEQNMSEQLFERLCETADTLQQRRVMHDSDIAVGFMSVAVAIATNALGPVPAAEWIRDVADSIEAQLGRMQ